MTDSNIAASARSSNKAQSTTTDHQSPAVTSQRPFFHVGDGQHLFSVNAGLPLQAGDETALRPSSGLFWKLPHLADTTNAVMIAVATGNGIQPAGADGGVK